MIKSNHTAPGTNVNTQPSGCGTPSAALKRSAGGSFFGSLNSWVFRHSLSLWVFGCLGISSVGISPASAATFDEQLKAVSVSIETQPEEVIISLLQAGIKEGKPSHAIAETQKWLRQNLPKDAILLYYAGQAAELSGDWKGAAVLFKQYLKNADLKSATADQAVQSVYSLLIDQLKDTSGAYAFGLTDGNRVMVCPRARQFDTWFLDEAMRRKDAEAVAARLHACIKAGLSTDLLNALYSNYFKWLLEQVDTLVERGPITADLVTNCKKLSKAMTFNEEMALRLDWAVSVKAYNKAKLAGKVVLPPIAEATALLAKYPQYALWVQDGWAGGGVIRNYLGDQAKYWPHEIEAKMAPVVAAAAKLTPLQFAGLMRSWRGGHYGKVVRPAEVKAVRKVFHFARYGDKLTTRDGVLILGKKWNEFTPEEAQKMATNLAHVADPQASLIRAIAAGGADKDLNKMIEALIGPEAWRLGVSELDRRYADQLWHYAGRPGGNATRDQKIKQSKAVAAKIKAAALDLKATPAQRMALFKNLWADYRSKQPKIPGVYDQLKAIILITPEAIPILLKDSSVEGQLLARNAIAKGVSGSDPLWKEIEATKKVNVNNYAPSILNLVQHHRLRKVSELKKRFPAKCKPHPLEAAMRKSVADGLKRNKLEPWKAMAWINMQYPEDNAEQIKLMQMLLKSPVLKTMPFEIELAARAWFKKDVMTPAHVAIVDSSDPAIVCKDLLALPMKAAVVPKKGDAETPIAPKTDVATAISALTKAIDATKKSPVRLEIDAAVQIVALDEAIFSDPKVFELILDITDSIQGHNLDLTRRVLSHLSKLRDPIMLQRSASYLWPPSVQVSRGATYKPLKSLIESLIDDRPEAAYALARSGVFVLANNGKIYGFDPQSHVPEMQILLGKSAMQLGLITIPVPRNHPAFPIYSSQAEWMTDNQDSAWQRCDENWEQLIQVHRKLSVTYLNWVLQRVIYSRDQTRQEELIKALLAWAAEPTTPITVEQKIQLELSYGDIAMQRGQLREAHQIYTKTQNNKAYEGVLGRYQATLRKADAERIGKDFDAALKTLGELELERIPEMWSPARYARAVVNYDMEEYDDAADDIQSILAREANHGEAKILLGKVQLKRKKLMEATEIEVTAGSNQTTLVPGEKLKVTLVDPTLAVSGAGTEIEVVVWAKSGDKERFFLRQFGDQKTKFRGEVATALGAPNSGDRVLQVIGDDEVFYAYSERFREKMNNIAEKRGGPITIASNSTLMASSRKLLTEDEQRIADMEKQMEALSSNKNSGASEAEITALAKAASAAEAGRKMLAGESMDEDSEGKKKESPVATRVKPGNPIHVRVIDHDRSRTSGIDELTVRVESSSGDSISRIILKETDTHSGWFEGSIPTTGAQAMAFAQNSAPGRNPNMVLSSQVSYPAWQPVSTKGVTPEFNVDLNDNVELGEMTITAKEQGSKLKKFVILTGMNPKEMTAVAVYPDNQLILENPWQPSVTVMNDTDRLHTGKGRKEFNLPEMMSHLNRGWMTQTYAQGVSANVAGPSEAMPEALYKSVKWKRQNRHAVSSVIYRFQGYFYEPIEVKRQFKLELGEFKIPKKTHSSIKHKPKFILAVDGRPITTLEGKQLEGSINLRPGVHKFEIWAIGWVANLGFGRDVKLLSNLSGGDSMVDCPDSFFDSTKFPKGILTHRNASAAIVANDAGTEFKVKFAPDSRSRLFKLVFIENEGPIPALNKLSLTAPDGKKVLPVAEDYATLNKNDTLEILTGDKISVRYIDDRFVTKSFERRERMLQVEFSTAKLEFADMKPRYDSGRKKDMPYYEKLLRFPYGQPLSLAINDADMDVSIEPDTLKVSVQSKAGGKREFIATETGPSTGIFEAIMMPVATPVSDENQIQVAEGGVLTAIYRDQENTKPGVPTDRFATIGHAAYTLPQLSLSQPTISLIDYSTGAEDLPGYQSLTEGFFPMDEWQMKVETDSARKAREAGRGLIRPSWSIAHKLYPTTKPPEGGFQSVHGRRMYIELLAPQLALGATSTVTIYAQTDSGRKLAQVPLDGKVFDLNVPGTIELIGHLTPPEMKYRDIWRGTPEIASYTGNSYNLWSDNTDRDRFTIDVPLIAGNPVEYGVLTREERYELLKKARTGEFPYEEYSKLKVIGLTVLPGERIHIGVQYKDKLGIKQWLTTTSKVITHPVFDVMEDDYRAARTSAYVGETINLRVVDLGGDVSNKNDTVSVLMQAKSGAKHRVDLRESTPHSGIFKGSYKLSYLKALDLKDTIDPAGDLVIHNVRRHGFPVVYDDTVAMRYTGSNGLKSPTRMITISKGSDGTIKPFSKQYDDPEIAMRTQFSLAESYLELAKSHRKLGKKEMAAREYIRAKQLLAKAMDQFKDPQTRSHAEYLLGTLSLEEANNTPEGDIKETRYRAALSRFMNVVGSYPNTIHASKAQYRIATVYEKLKQPDIAAQEYVKLAYKHPDSEYLATAMAKLGSYFLRSASTYEKEAKELLADTDNKDAQFKGEARQALAEREYIKTAQIFSRLQQRFPTDSLAGKAGIRAGQAYMRAKKTNEALAVFLSVVKDQGYDGKTLRSQGMYWAGMCYQSLRQEMAAYSIYKRLTYDFPESKWAAYARGRLSQGKLQKLENELEIERLEEGR